MGSRGSPRNGCPTWPGASAHLRAGRHGGIVAPGPEPYLEAIRAYQQADFDEVYLGQADGNLEGAFEFFATELLPRARQVT